MKKYLLRTVHYILLTTFLPMVLITLTGTAGFSQQPVGIGTTTPDSHAALDITSQTKGVLFPSLTALQQTNLGSMLTAAETGMIITDAATGNLKVWTGSAWQTPAPSTPLTANAPLMLQTNNISINAGTAAGDLLTWDGNNWINSQPAVQHFTFTVDNRQPYLAVNYQISLFGIYPTQNFTPFVGEIDILGCNFNIVGYAYCDGSLIPISENTALFSLIGTTYGGDGVSTFALPDLRGRAAVDQGNVSGTPFAIGQSGGTESKTFSH